MKLQGLLAAICLFCTFALSAQPVWSPQKRADMEMRWMKDSLQLTPGQVQKANPVVLSYQQQKDANGDTTKQHELMKEKDRSMKAILDKEQYKKYYRREKQIRALPKPNHSGPHQAF